MKRLIAAALFALPSLLPAQQAYTPLSGSLSFDLTASPVVSFAGRTENLTPYLNNEWFSFLWAWQPPTGNLHRVTLAARARDGLASFVGNFGGPSSTGWDNAGPTFTNGSTLFYLFDVEISGAGTWYGFQLTDLDGDSRDASQGFQTPGGSTVAPEPSTVALLAFGIAAISFARRKRA